MSDKLTGQTVELLQAMIRNACVNDGTVESGQEIRNAELLADFLSASGIDFEVPDMVLAAVARPPVYGAKPLSFDEKAAKGVPGVLAVVPLEDRVAVCARDTYAALQGREALDINWSDGSHPDLNDENLDNWYRDHLCN